MCPTCEIMRDFISSPGGYAACDEEWIETNQSDSQIYALLAIASAVVKLAEAPFTAQKDALRERS
jgi:hypothetical protein